MPWMPCSHNNAHHDEVNREAEGSRLFSIIDLQRVSMSVGVVREGHTFLNWKCSCNMPCALLANVSW